MELTKIELNRARLMALGEDEVIFFFGFGHFANEVNAITKLMYWAANEEEIESPQFHGNETMLAFLLRMLGSKLFEGWRLLETTFLKRELGKTYVPLLDTETNRMLEGLKVYFGKKNAAEIIRNNFGFHYSVENFPNHLAGFTGPLLLYLDGVTAANSLFYFSEAVLVEAMISFLQDEGIERTLNELVVVFFEVAVHFSQVIDGIIDAIIEKNSEGELRLHPPEPIDLLELPNFEEISISWFTNMNSILDVLP